MLKSTALIVLMFVSANLAAHAEVRVIADFEAYDEDQALTEGPATFAIDVPGEGPAPMAVDMADDGDLAGWFGNRGAGNFIAEGIHVSEGGTATLQFDVCLTGRASDATLGLGALGGKADASDTTGCVRIDGDGGDNAGPVIESFNGDAKQRTTLGALSVGIAYTVTIVMDTHANTFDVWIQGGPQYPSPTRLAEGFRFWNTSDHDLDVFVVRTNHANRPGAIVIDDVVLDTAAARTERFNQPATQ